jgi:hypothetical protein
VTRQQAVHSANIITVAISSDESLLATGSTDRTIAIFSLAAVADDSALQPLLVVKVTEAVCLDISWGRCRNRARVMPLLCLTFFFRRAAGTQHLFFASFMSGAPPQPLSSAVTPYAVAQHPPAPVTQILPQLMPTASLFPGEVAIVDARSGATLSKLKQVQ